MGPEPLLLDELKSCVCSILLDLLDRTDHILVSYATDIARHVLRHAPSSVVGDIQVVAQRSPVALLAL